MPLKNIVEIIRDFEATEDYNLDLAGGRIYIDDDNLKTEADAFLKSAEANANPTATKLLEKILILNSRLQTENMDDSEPLESELLQACSDFLELTRGRS